MIHTHHADATPVDPAHAGHLGSRPVYERHWPDSASRQQAVDRPGRGSPHLGAAAGFSHT